LILITLDLPCGGLPFKISSSNLSIYAAGLPNNTIKERYLQKLQLIHNIDPYSKNDLNFSSDFTNLTKLFEVSLIDIYNFLVLRVSFYSNEQMKAYKSLDAYNYFLSGFVNSVKYTKLDGKLLIIGKVSH